MSDELKLQLMQEIAKSNLKIDQLILEVRGDNYYNKHREEVTKVDDEQVSKAIISINGDEKPLNEKQLFLGVICVLLSKYGWAGNWSDCCNRINRLPMKDMFVKGCDYGCIKILTGYKFASVDYKDWDKYEPSRSEAGIFKKCKYVADAFDEAVSVLKE